MRHGANNGKARDALVVPAAFWLVLHWVCGNIV